MMTIVIWSKNKFLSPIGLVHDFVEFSRPIIANFCPTYIILYIIYCTTLYKLILTVEVTPLALCLLFHWEQFLHSHCHCGKQKTSCCINCIKILFIIPFNPQHESLFLCFLITRIKTHYKCRSQNHWFHILSHCYQLQLSLKITA